MPITLFDWLNNITVGKQDWDSFSENDKESFNPYMVHRFVSMYEPYADLANIAQKIPYTEKEKTYLIYKTMLPRKKVFFKYVKGCKNTPNEQLLKHIADYYTISLGEAHDYIYILKREGIEHILEKSGVNEKDIKKLLKEIK